MSLALTLLFCGNLFCSLQDQGKLQKLLEGHEFGAMVVLSLSPQIPEATSVYRMLWLQCRPCLALSQWAPLLGARKQPTRLWLQLEVG